MEMSQDFAKPSKVAWIYPIYISVACLFTAGLNIVHTKYILKIPTRSELFIIPILAGIVFGLISARIRLENYQQQHKCDWVVYSKYILFSCLVTSSINVVHTDWVLQQGLSLDLFIAPVIAGVFFGYLLARVKTLNNRLLHLASTDIMTKLYNRMQFDIQLSRQIRKIERHGGTFSIIYIDVDNFKQINDNYGHQIGDKVLISIAEHIRQVRKHNDIVARYGGDEFIILSPNTNIDTAARLAEQLKNSIYQLEDKELPAFSCSFGVAEYDKDKNNNHNLIKAVDKALYKAKNRGRNSVVAA